LHREGCHRFISAAREAVREAIDAGDWIAVELAKHRKEA
jgi:sarcosine oxidase delta subunit